ncbi:MAG: nucleotidyltransferase domain-containing protein [Candidatus Gastranaerophilaceae bacterium]|jgi:predicted nucleotidyltransferase|nr:nucleotidyltransferase domain-containing protein [Candidatus Gastranaerophilaceae bacterium]
MSNKVHEVIKLLSGAFRRRFNDYKGLYLFGAYLDGQEHEDEDIEIVALFDNTDKAKRENIWPVIGKIETELDVSLDVYPYTEEEFKNDDVLYDEVISEGIFYNPLGIAKKD